MRFLEDDMVGVDASSVVEEAIFCCFCIVIFLVFLWGLQCALRDSNQAVCRIIFGVVCGICVARGGVAGFDSRTDFLSLFAFSKSQHGG